LERHRAGGGHREKATDRRAKGNQQELRFAENNMMTAAVSATARWILQAWRNKKIPFSIWARKQRGPISGEVQEKYLISFISSSRWKGLGEELGQMGPKNLR